VGRLAPPFGASRRAARAYPAGPGCVTIGGVPRTHRSDRWVRAQRGGKTVVDSRRALLVWRDRPYPSFAFPTEDVRGVESTPLEDIPGHVAVAWNAVDAWLEDDEPLVAHARDPFSRIDVRHSSRHVVIEHEDEVIADSHAALLLYETGLPVRFYLPPEDVRKLEPSPMRTRCAYKGEAEHFSHNGTDVAWVYRDPLFDAPPIKDRIGFYTERVDLVVDGERQERPHTQWS
jgi:uncharacterized protein (DUF427 family)